MQSLGSGRSHRLNTMPCRRLGCELMGVMEREVCVTWLIDWDLPDEHSHVGDVCAHDLDVRRRAIQTHVDVGDLTHRGPIHLNVLPAIVNIGKCGVDGDGGRSIDDVHITGLSDWTCGGPGRSDFHPTEARDCLCERHVPAVCPSPRVGDVVLNQCLCAAAAELNLDAWHGPSGSPSNRVCGPTLPSTHIRSR